MSKNAGIAHVSNGTETQRWISGIFIVFAVAQFIIFDSLGEDY